MARVGTRGHMIEVLTKSITEGLYSSMPVGIEWEVEVMVKVKGVSGQPEFIDFKVAPFRDNQDSIDASVMATTKLILNTKEGDTLNIEKFGNDL